MYSALLFVHSVFRWLVLLQPLTLIFITGIVLFGCKKNLSVSTPVGDDEKSVNTTDPYADKVCINALNRDQLVGKWYNISPRQEESNSIISYYTKIDHVAEMNNSGLIILLNADSTYESIRILPDGEEGRVKGTWNFLPEVRALVINREIDEKLYTGVYTVLELNEDYLLYKLDPELERSILNEFKD